MHCGRPSLTGVSARRSRREQLPCSSDAGWAIARGRRVRCRCARRRRRSESCLDLMERDPAVRGCSPDAVRGTARCAYPIRARTSRSSAMLEYRAGRSRLLAPHVWQNHQLSEHSPWRQHMATVSCGPYAVAVGAEDGATVDGGGRGRGRHDDCRKTLCGFLAGASGDELYLVGLSAGLVTVPAPVIGGLIWGDWGLSTFSSFLWR